jgi:hypothetical protein
MHSIIRPDEQERTPTGTVRWEGEASGSGVSLFLVYNQPGEGPDLHRHSYSESGSSAQEPCASRRMAPT